MIADRRWCCATLTQRGGALYAAHAETAGSPFPRADIFHSIRKVVALSGKPKELRRLNSACLNFLSWPEAEELRSTRIAACHA